MASIRSDSSGPLAQAEILAELGVPIFSARLKANGDPLPPTGWEKTRASVAAATRFRAGPSNALCAVMGTVYDVIDIDPRNGGAESIRVLSDKLGDDGPEIYWQVDTPSGGKHLWIASLGIGSHGGFMPGLDLKGGRPDGSSRGFVFLPPTIRPSKVDGQRRPYKSSNGELNDSDPVVCEALVQFVKEKISRENSGDGPSPGREDSGNLRKRCVEAEAGEQRGALLRYIHELERKGYARDDIVTVVMSLIMDMPTYDTNRPWTEKDIRGLLHRSGRITADARAEELEGLSGPITGGLVRNLSDLKPDLVKWLWLYMLAYRELTILDGEKGQGKSFIIDQIAAIASRGLPFPGTDGERYEPIRSIIFTDEGHLESTTVPRLLAANADMSMISVPNIKVPKRNKDDWGLALPDGAARMEKMIVESGAQIAFWDPISDFLDESINSHNDASVRRALRPLNGILNRTCASGLAVRHLNKDSKQEARFRGSGSVAFANRARVHLLAARLPPGHEGDFGIGVLSVNLAKRPEGCLAYSIVDSGVVGDDAGNMVGKLEWHGHVDVPVEDLGKYSNGRGPTPVVQDEIIDILAEMFERQEVWESSAAFAELRSAGVTANKETIIKARKRAGIVAKARFKEGKIDGWFWRMKVKETIDV